MTWVRGKPKGAKNVVVYSALGVKNYIKNLNSVGGLLALTVLSTAAHAQPSNTDDLPIADMHVHYSHDSVELTPPARVIELMREANLKFAMVSSSDDNGTKLLRDLAPDLIIPELRPYRRRGELNTWFKDEAALAYVEKLLSTQTYAGIGEFHLSGDEVLLPIPRRIVELAEQHNLILHAHSDAQAIENLFSLSDKVKVLWAHSGFEGPEEIAQMLTKHDRLWADLAFRSEMHSSPLSNEWKALFKEHPNRVMLGTDTYTPERMYFLPEHASLSRSWLSELPQDTAERVAWRNAYDFIMPVWHTNQGAHAGDDAHATMSQHNHSENHMASHGKGTHEQHMKAMKNKASNASAERKQTALTLKLCDTKSDSAMGDGVKQIDGEHFTSFIEPLQTINVSEDFAVSVLVCTDANAVPSLAFDATMPSHGHGMNYVPEVTLVNSAPGAALFEIEGVVFHMPGQWQFELNVKAAEHAEKLAIPEKL